MDPSREEALRPLALKTRLRKAMRATASTDIAMMTSISEVPARLVAWPIINEYNPFHMYSLRDFGISKDPVPVSKGCPPCRGSIPGGHLAGFQVLGTFSCDLMGRAGARVRRGEGREVS